MELQWPLIIFTTLIAASAGLFAVQGIYALAGKGEKAQMPALITSFALLVVGGIAVFFHLEHAERIFNGFGHITSGITQELIFIVIMFIVMVIAFAGLRRNGKMAKWVAILAIVSAVALVFVMGHSYMMASRPAWNSIWQILSLIGAAAVIGTGIFAALDAAEEDGKINWLSTIIGSGAGLVTTLIYLFSMNGATSKFTQVGTYFDPTHPNMHLPEVSSFAPFAGGNAGLSICAILLGVAAVACAVLGKKSGNWKVYGWIIAGCGLVAAILLRVVFYQTGASVYMYY